MVVQRTEYLVQRASGIFTQECYRVSCIVNTMTIPKQHDWKRTTRSNGTNMYNPASNPFSTRSMRPVRTASTPLLFTPARSALHRDARGFVHPAVTLTRCNWYHPVEQAREYAHLPPQAASVMPSRPPWNALVTLLSPACPSPHVSLRTPNMFAILPASCPHPHHPAGTCTSLARRLGWPTLPAVSHSPSCHYSDYTHRYFILRT